MTEPAPDHIELTVRQMAELQEQHQRDATSLERCLGGLSTAMAMPLIPVILAGLIVLWMGYNALAPRMSWPAPDPAPFYYLATAASALALSTTVLILASQRRADIAATRRAQLTLQLAALSEQKVAKVIALLEEQRRQSPILPDRTDALAEAMAEPADPKLVLDRIVATHEDTEGGG